MASLKHFQLLVSIFKKNGIEPIECINKKFDPNIHQAMSEIDDENLYELFWIFFPNARGILHDAKVFNPKNKRLPPKLNCISKNHKHRH